MTNKSLMANKKDKFNYRINNEIRSNKVRLIGEGEGFLSGEVYLTKKALEIADDNGLDLIEISPKADPPVCRIEDVGKFKYELKMKQKALAANQKKTETKEIRLTPNISEGDIEFKQNHAKNFLKKGNHVKLTVIFKGRAITYKDAGKKVILEFAQSLSDFGTPESMPQMVGKRMTMNLKPKKS